MDIEHYLARLGLSARPQANLAGLTRVIRAHLFAIPFENLDVQLGRPVSLDSEVQFRKIVAERRGGWCFEVNGLLGWALAELGFAVTRLAGAVQRQERGPAADGNHLLLKVSLDGADYLADVGFGQGPREPVALRPQRFISGGQPYALERVDAAWWRLSVRIPGDEMSYDFTLDPADEALLAAQSNFLQTAEQSPFVQNAVAMRHLPEGIVALRGRVVQHIGRPGRSERLLADAADLVATLRDGFGLDLPEAAQLWPQIVARHEALFGTDSAA